MPKNYTYTDAGVNREQRHESKKALQTLQKTYKFSHFGPVIHLPYSNIFPLSRDMYLDLTIEGVGTKVLLAQLAGKYDTIGIDAVAMAVNDVIRSGATPLAISDNIHAQASNPKLVKEWLEGIARGAEMAECPVVSGEIGDVAEIINGIAEGAGFDMIVAAIGHVAKHQIITGAVIKPDDPIIGLPSSGLHSNGITLARKILLKQWGGKHEPHDKPEPLDREIITEMLEPTRIYVKPLLKAAETARIKAAVHITGDGYLKFNNLTAFSPGIGFKFNNFKPQPVFSLIQRTALELGYTITDKEMFQTFNMGWGFAIIVNKTDQEKAIAALENAGAQPELIGKVTDKQQIEIHYGNKSFVLT
ncbi:MAG: phosphoribosylformylglycinamidine cyclo-ligase [Candidatus Bathyarchaeota archaeon]|nr:phosphoribosylformylglycinamidine cyclo-ligase [Candidatus Bathyarchaeota archaeon]